MKKKMVRTNLYLTKSQYGQVRQEADKRGITFSEMFRKIVDKYLDNKKDGK